MPARLVLCVEKRHRSYSRGVEPPHQDSIFRIPDSDQNHRPWKYSWRFDDVEILTNPADESPPTPMVDMLWIITPAPDVLTPGKVQTTEEGLARHTQQQMFRTDGLQHLHHPLGLGDVFDDLQHHHQVMLLFGLGQF